MIDAWEPTPKQKLFLSCPYYEVLYGGAKGGGKSDAMLRMHLQQLRVSEERFAATKQKSKGWAVFFRESMPQLEEVIVRSQLIFPQMGATYKSDTHTWVWPSGYRFQFAHLHDPDSHIAWNGKEITLLMIDQVEEIPEHVYLYLRMQVRSSDRDLSKMLAVRLSANPLGRHVQWVKKRFIGEFKDGGHDFVEEYRLRDGRAFTRSRVFIKSTVHDNPHINDDYIVELMSLPEHMRRGYLEGDWDVSFGSFFGDVWDRGVHVVEPFPISKHWEIFRMADWGSRAPACCLWAAVDNDGDIVVFDELYGPGSTGREWGKKILAVEQEYGFVEEDPETKRILRSKLAGPIDWAANAQNGAEGPTAIEAMLEMGIQWYAADKRRKEGAAEVRNRLISRTNARKPGIRIFSHCSNLIRTLPNLVADEREPDDIAHGATGKQEDHCLAAGTIVHTAAGPVAIESLVGRAGLAIGKDGENVPFFDVRLTDAAADCVEVQTSGGHSVICTPNHRILTTSGWKEAGDLSLRDAIHCVTMQKWTQSQNRLPGSDLMASPTTCVAAISSEMGSGFIEPCGNEPMARRREGSTSTMSTAIDLTIASRTSNSSQPGNTSHSMASLLPPGEWQLLNGTPPARSAMGMPGSLAMNAPSRLVSGGRSGLNPRPPAPSAEFGTPPTIPSAASFADSSAGNVHFEPVVALLPAGTRPVFDLSVESSDHAFAVNGGVVVHNCYDAFRYGMMSRPLVPKDEHDTELNEYQRAMLGRALERQAEAFEESRDDTTGY